MKKQGIFELWLKNFMSLVFMQAFQAIFLAVVVFIMGKIIEGASSTVVLGENFPSFGATKGENNKYLICTIVAYVGITGVIKLEKLTKAIFGVQDSPLFGDMSDSMKKLMHSAMHMKGMTAALTGTGRAALDARRNKLDAAKKVSNIKDRLNQGNNSSIVNNLNVGPGNSSGKGENNGRSLSRNDIAAMFADGRNFDKSGNFNPNAMSTSDQLLYDAEQEKMKADREFQHAKSRMAVQALSTAAGLGWANGGSDDIEETLVTGDWLSKGVAIAGNHVAGKPLAEKAARNNVAKELKANKVDLQKIMKENIDASNTEITKNAVHTASVMNDAIIDASKDISNGIKVPKTKTEIKAAANKASNRVKKEADLWLNTQIKVEPDKKISGNREARNIVDRARNNRK